MSKLFREKTDGCWRPYLFSNYFARKNLNLHAPAVRAAESRSESINVGFENAMDDLINERDLMFTLSQVGYLGLLIFETTPDYGYYEVGVQSSIWLSLMYDAKYRAFLNTLCAEHNGNYLSPIKSVAYIEKIVLQLFKNCEIRARN